MNKEQINEAVDKSIASMKIDDLELNIDQLNTIINSLDKENSSESLIMELVNLSNKVDKEEVKRYEK